MSNYDVDSVSYTVDGDRIMVKVDDDVLEDGVYTEYIDRGELRDHLSNLYNVTTVYIYGEDGTELPDDLFEGLISIREVILDRVSIDLSEMLSYMVHSVNKLVLRNMNIDSLSHAYSEELKELTIEYCTYTKDTPLDLNGCNYLRHLSMNESNIGHIPEVSWCYALEIIEIWSCDCSMTDTSTIDWRQLKRLGSVSITDCGISGYIPYFDYLNIGTLSLSDNDLYGTIDDLSTLDRLINLNVSNNRLSGTLDALDTLTELETLRVNNNDFHGSIEDVIHSNPRLRLVDITDTSIDIPHGSIVENIALYY